MSRLHQAADEALRNKQAEEEAARRAIAESTARAGVKRVERSDLGKWFPQVEWEFVANLSDGATVVREKDGVDVLLGVKVAKDGTVDQGPDEWEVAIYAKEAGIFGATGGFRRVEQLKTPADLGEYLEKTEPKCEPMDEEATT